MLLEFLIVLQRVTFYFTLFTISIYITLLYSLIKHRAYVSNSFFTLCISEGISDILWTLHKAIFMEFIPAFVGGPFFPGSTIVATAGKMGDWYIYGTEVFGVLLLAINRYSAIAWPMSYETIWTKRTTIAVVAIHWLLPLPVAIPMFFPCCHSFYLDDSMLRVFNDSRIEEIYTQGSVIVELMIISPSLFILYSIIFIKIWKQRQTVATNSNTDRKDHINAAIIGALISVIYLIYKASYTYASVNDFTFTSVLWFIIVNDLFTLLNPYLLICFSTKARALFFKTASCGKIKQSNKTVTSKRGRTGQTGNETQPKWAMPRVAG